MADRLCASIQIGGRLARANVHALLTAIDQANVSIEWGDSKFAPADADELLLAMNDGNLWLCDHEACYGEFPELEEACRDLGLAYRRHTGGKYEYDSELVDWRAGMSQPLVRTGSNDSSTTTYVPSNEVKEALDCLEAGKVPQAIKILRELCPEVAPLPPFEIV